MKKYSRLLFFVLLGGLSCGALRDTWASPLQSDESGLGVEIFRPFFLSPKSKLFVDPSWLTSDVDSIEKLLSENSWEFLGRGQSSFVFKVKNEPFVVKVPFTMGNADPNLKEAVNANVITRELRKYLDKVAYRSAFGLKIRTLIKNAILKNYTSSGKSRASETEDSALIQGYQLWQSVFENKIDPLPVRLLKVKSESLISQLQQFPEASLFLKKIQAEENTLVILQQAMDAKFNSFESRIVKAMEKGDLQAAKKLMKSLFEFQDFLVSEGVMDIDLWVFDNYGANLDSDVFCMDPGGLRQISTEHVLFLKRNLERAHKLKKNSPLSSSDQESDLYRVAKSVERWPGGAQLMPHYLDQIIEYSSKWLSKLEGESLSSAGERLAVGVSG